MLVKNIIFRTMADSRFGYGHLARSLRLEAYFRNSGHRCIVVVDNLIPSLCNFHCVTNFLELYPSGSFSEEVDDSKIFLKSFNKISDAIVILDDYRLGSLWERVVRPHAGSLVVLDDTNIRDHYCDFLIDAKWQGSETATRYDDKLNSDCKRLLGPKYLMIDPCFADARLSIKSKKNNRLNVLINIGGGGDWNDFKAFVETLIFSAKSKNLVYLRLLSGPLSKGQEYIESLTKKYNFIFSVGPLDNLVTELSQTDLFITAAGGSLFEALALHIPTVSFELSANQENNSSHLEELGHYFSIGKLQHSHQEQFAKLCNIMFDQFERIKTVANLPRQIEIDGAGVERVANAVLTGFAEPEEYPTCHELESESHPETVRYVQKVDDTHINLYRRSRNLATNLSNMTDTTEVSALDHYIWWFSKNQRCSYIVKKGELEEIIFWHHLVQIKVGKFLVGGWFSCFRKASGSAAIFALTAQLKITDKLHPGVPWVAVINKNNKFVLKMNQMFGFKEAQINSVFFDAARESFPRADPDKFCFVYRDGSHCR